MKTAQLIHIEVLVLLPLDLTLLHCIVLRIGIRYLGGLLHHPTSNAWISNPKQALEIRFPGGLAKGCAADILNVFRGCGPKP